MHLNIGGQGIFSIDWDKKKCRDAAIILRKPNVPQDVVEQKLTILREWLGKNSGEAVTEDEIVSAAGLVVKVVAETYVPPERQLFTKLQLLDAPDSEIRCQAFVVSWRQLFLDTLHPQHLPAGHKFHGCHMIF